ncbi:MAG: DNA polymerase III subunit beta [Candidatus Dadabacteria bacterium]|nr:DNA polymerase III subunit beta [Candidatus Dadabacteria bacterium]NIS07959.1 DNA polymerase III subunit beta [Candidatus Dadabacteria bacterium]NIV43052.1 DNA polymerase III subunit beta [Candidatus Dadabacteria bacterium]NIX14915.1 DNA polymerase III subunit beta [Candidatus Dadabacteria bacterium]NIY21543.1 DNA polymerase III subunit beta [Candidatus Dadabacteria bacterium]
MKFVCDAVNLSEKLSIIQGISERRITMPILSHVLLCTDDNHITVTATDLENTLETQCSSIVQGGGKIALPSKKLFEIIREIHSGEIEIEELENNWVQIKSAGVSFKLAGLPAADFPSLPVQHLQNQVEVEAGSLDDMIAKTFFAVSADDLRRNLAGLYFEPHDDGLLRIIGTDGHRLSYVERKFENGHGFTNGIILPRKGVAELRKLLKNSGEGDIKLAVINNFFIAQSKDIRLFSRLIELDYPDYKQVVPEQSKSSFVVNRDILSAAVKRVSVLSSEKTKSIKMNISSNSVQLLSVTPELGEAKELIDVEYSDDPVELGFNSVYIMDVLDAMDSEQVVIEITDELSPAIIKPTGQQDYVSVIMPMRV